jgi:pimeloyl-ACP methyl ester carboxylesterase
LCAAGGVRGLVYSRPGYGRSTPRPPEEAWPVTFMHIQAYEVLPAVLAALEIDAERSPPWLFGHSDGASIALLYGARYPDRVAGIVAAAPHIFVEPVTIDNIARARRAYREGGLKAGLARYHDDPDSAFFGWNDIWLDPAFAAWTIEAELAAIRCPVLAIQGEDDEYGTLAQITGIRDRLPATRLVALPDCGHAPHRDQPQALIAAVLDFVGPRVVQAAEISGG